MRIKPKYLPLLTLISLLLAGCEYIDTAEVLAGIAEAILQAETRSDWDEPGDSPAMPDPERSALGGEEYLRFLRSSLDSVGADHPQGERLIRFWDNRARRARYRDGNVIAVGSGLQGTHFWVALLDSIKESAPVRYEPDRDVLLVSPMELTSTTAGLLTMRQLHLAWLDLTGAEPLGTDIAGYLRGAVESEEVAIALLDSLHHGRYGGLLRTGLKEKRYVQDGERIRIPNEALIRKLDELLGPAGDFERMLRREAYAAALTLIGSRSLADRYYGMAELKAVRVPDLADLMETAWVDHDHFHMGRDVSCRPGEDVTAPIRGIVAGFVEPVAPRSTWGGVVVRGSGRDANRTVRILGVQPSVAAGARVDTFTVIGRAQNAREDFSDLKPYLHVELYVAGVRTDPFDWLLGVDSMEWKGRHFLEPDAQSKRIFRHDRLVSEGLQRELKGDARGAVEWYTNALDHPEWEVPSTETYHYLARAHATQGDFAEAVVTQQALLSLLEYELAYSQGEVPHPELGPIAASRSPESLRLLIHHHTVNLQAYQRQQRTVYIYD